MPGNENNNCNNVLFKPFLLYQLLLENVQSGQRYFDTHAEMFNIL